MKTSRQHPPADFSRLDADLTTFSELPPGYSPEFLLRATRPISSSTVAASDSAPPAVRARGSYRSIRQALGTQEQVEEAIVHLRSLAKSDKGSKDIGADEIVEAWIAVEAHLTDAEREDLFAKVIGRVFPKSQVTVPPSRRGFAQAQGE